MKKISRLQGFMALLLVMVAAGCATVPTVVPQALIDARSALASAKKTNADMLVSEEYQEARKRLEHAEGAFSADQSIATVEELSFEAKSYAEIAEAHARTRIVEQEYESKQQALITQQTMLQALTLKVAEIQRAQDQIRKSEEDKLLAQAKAAEAAKEAADAAKKAEEERQKREELEKMLAEAKKIQNANVTMEARGLVINLSGKVLFDTGSSKLRAGAKAALSEVAGFLKKYSQYKVKIEGHTDSTGSDLTNNTLSQARAESVLNFLQQQEVPFDSMQAVGLGSERPIATNETPTGRQLNRRVEIILQKKTETPQEQ